MKKILSITGIILITFIIFIFLSSCTLIKKLPEIDNSKVKTTEDITGAPDEEDDQSGLPDNNTDISQQVLYLDIGISENSMHFEHRIASIYSIDPN